METNGGHTNPPPDEVSDELKQQVKQIAGRYQDEPPLSYLDPAVERQRIENTGRRFDIILKIVFAFVILIALITQLVVVNVVFVYYAKYGVDWEIPKNVLALWFGGTVIEIIGVVHIIAHNLFPAIERARRASEEIDPEA